MSQNEFQPEGKEFPSINTVVDVSDRIELEPPAPMPSWPTFSDDFTEVAAGVKADLEKMALIEAGEYVEPEPVELEETSYRGYEGQRIWLVNQMRKDRDMLEAIARQAKEEEQRKSEEAIAQAAAEAEEKRLRRLRENKELGESTALYILMRTDMASLNAGKAVAQGTHATNLFEKDVRILREGFPEAPNVIAYEAWLGDRGFGTAITLGVTGETLGSIVEQAIATGCIAGICTDPTYPLRDGDVTHLLNIDTCGYIFGNREYLAEILGHLELMR
jgi:hypothetical protein